MLQTWVSCLCVTPETWFGSKARSWCGERWLLPWSIGMHWVLVCNPADSQDQTWRCCLLGLTLQQFQLHGKKPASTNRLPAIWKFIPPVCHWRQRVGFKDGIVNHAMCRTQCPIYDWESRQIGDMHLPISPALDVLYSSGTSTYFLVGASYISAAKNSRWYCQSIIGVWVAQSLYITLKPVRLCQGGWATTVVGARNPSLVWAIGISANYWGLWWIHISHLMLGFLCALTQLILFSLWPLWTESLDAKALSYSRSWTSSTNPGPCCIPKERDDKANHPEDDQQKTSAFWPNTYACVC